MTLNARTVIDQGFRAFQIGASILSNPYDKPEEDTHETLSTTYYDSRGKPIRNRVMRVRVAIDYNELWERGWQLGEAVASRDLVSAGT